MLVVNRVRPARCRRAQCGARRVMAWTRWCPVCSCLPSTSGTGSCSPTWAPTLSPSHPLSMASLYPRFMLSSTNLSGKSFINLGKLFLSWLLCYIMSVRCKAAGKSGMRSSTESGREPSGQFLCHHKHEYCIITLIHSRHCLANCHLHITKRHADCSLWL